MVIIPVEEHVPYIPRDPFAAIEKAEIRNLLKTVKCGIIQRNVKGENLTPVFSVKPSYDDIIVWSLASLRARTIIQRANTLLLSTNDKSGEKLIELKILLAMPWYQ